MNDRRRRFEAQALPHLDAAYNLARWLARPPVDADDIVQEAMLRAFRAFETFRGEDIRPWLLAIVRNCFLTAVAKTGRAIHSPLPADDDISARDSALIVNDPDPETVVIQFEGRRRLEAAVAALPEDFREVLVLREMEDLSYRQIAQVTGAPIGTVMSRLARARALLKSRWRGEAEGASHALP